MPLFLQSLCDPLLHTTLPPPWVYSVPFWKAVKMEQAVLCHANHLFSGAYLQVSKLQTDRVRAESWKQPWQQLALLGSRLLMLLIPCQLNTSRFLIRKKNTNINPPPPAVLKTISTNAVPLGSLLCPHSLPSVWVALLSGLSVFPRKNVSSGWMHIAKASVFLPRLWTWAQGLLLCICSSLSASHELCWINEWNINYTVNFPISVCQYRLFSLTPFSPSPFFLDQQRHQRQWPIKLSQMLSYSSKFVSAESCPEPDFT